MFWWQILNELTDDSSVYLDSFTKISDHIKLSYAVGTWRPALYWQRQKEHPLYSYIEKIWICFGDFVNQLNSCVLFFLPFLSFKRQTHLLERKANTEFRSWWHLLNVYANVKILFILVNWRHQHLKVSPTYFVSDIRHRHGCNRRHKELN